MGYITAFHNIVYEQSYTFENKVSLLLQLGLKIFNIDAGMVVHAETEDWPVLYSESYLSLRKLEQMRLPLKSFCQDVVAGTGTTSAKYNDNTRSHLFIGTPIIVEQQLFGVITFFSTKRSRNFSEKHVNFLEMFTKWFGNTLASERKLQRYESRILMQKRLEAVAKIGTWEVDLITNQISWSEQTKVIHEVPSDYVPNLETAINFYKEGESRNAITTAIEEAIMAGNPWELELELVTAKNRPVWVKANGIADLVEGKCVRLFGTFHDISDEIKHRQRLQVSALTSCANI